MIDGVMCDDAAFGRQTLTKTLPTAPQRYEIASTGAQPQIHQGHSVLYGRKNDLNLSGFTPSTRLIT